MRWPRGFAGLEKLENRELGGVTAAMFRIRTIHFALSHNDGHPGPDTRFWVSQDEADVDAALDVLLDALGIAGKPLPTPRPETEISSTSQAPPGGR